MYSTRIWMHTQTYAKMIMYSTRIWMHTQTYAKNRNVLNPNMDAYANICKNANALNPNMDAYANICKNANVLNPNMDAYANIRKNPALRKRKRSSSYCSLYIEWVRSGALVLRRPAPEAWSGAPAPLCSGAQLRKRGPASRTRGRSSSYCSLYIELIRSGAPVLQRSAPETWSGAPAPRCSGAQRRKPGLALRTRKRSSSYSSGSKRSLQATLIQLIFNPLKN